MLVANDPELSPEFMQSFLNDWSKRLHQKTNAAFFGVDWGTTDSIGVKMPVWNSSTAIDTGSITDRVAELECNAPPSIICTTHAIAAAIKEDLSTDGVKREISPEFDDVTRIDGMQIRSFDTAIEAVEAETELGRRAFAITLYKTISGRLVK